MALQHFAYRRFNTNLDKISILNDRSRHKESLRLLKQCKLILKVYNDDISNILVYHYDEDMEIRWRFYRLFVQYFIETDKPRRALKYYRKSIKYEIKYDSQFYFQQKKQKENEWNSFCCTMIGRLVMQCYYNEALYISDKLNFTIIVPYWYYVQVFDCYLMLNDIKKMRKYKKILKQKAFSENEKIICLNRENQLNIIMCSDNYGYRKLLQSIQKQLKQYPFYRKYSILYKLHISSLLSDSNVDFDDVEKYLFDEYTITQIANIQTQNNKFNAYKIYAALYREGTFIRHYLLENFAIFCLKFNNILLAKKLLREFKKHETAKNMLKEINEKTMYLRCSHCQHTMSRIKVCKACGNKYYCSRKCQKRSWSKEHRIQCNGQWKSCWERMSFDDMAQNIKQRPDMLLNPFPEKFGIYYPQYHFEEMNLFPEKYANGSIVQQIQCAEKLGIV
eukprot:194664_1